jgi:hypothetical protein
MRRFLITVIALGLGLGWSAVPGWTAVTRRRSCS